MYQVKLSNSRVEIINNQPYRQAEHSSNCLEIDEETRVNLDDIRKGGCFVSICRGISIAVLIFVFIFFLSFTIFFSTKYVYEHKPNITLEDFLNHRAYLIDKRARIPKHVIPKHYRLFIHPTFDDVENPFSYTGIVWITITSKKHNNKRIELNVKNLNIKMEDVTVMKSILLTNLDFDEDLDWDLSEEDLYSHPRRSKRDISNEDESEGEETDDAEYDERDVEIIDEIVSTNGSSPEKVDEDDIPSESTPNTTTKSIYFHPIFPPDEFVTIKITDLEFDDQNEKMIIYLGTEMKKDIYYIVKVNFTGNMTNDRGLFYTHYMDTEGGFKHFAGTIMEPNNARRLFPCMDDHNFRSPFEINIARKANMNVVSSMNLEMTEFLTNESDDIIVDTFNTTSQIRASEVGFVVTDMTPTKISITDNLSIIFYARDKYLEHVENIVLIFSKIIQIYENYMKLRYPFDVIKYITIPNVPKSIHEIKEGMILASEKRLIKDSTYFPSLDTEIHKEIAFELAKVWIHNLVDYKNKEHFWLHEAIPMYLQTVALQALELHVNYLDNFLLQGKTNAMRDEIYAKTTALNAFTNYYDENHYDLMRFKGLSVLRMMNYSLSEGQFDHFIHQYFSTRLNNDTIDIFEVLNADTQKVDENFNNFITTWITLEKYPIIEVKRRNITGHFELQQTSLSSSEDEIPDPFWTTPITFINDTSQKLLMEKVRWIPGEDNMLRIDSTCEAYSNNTWIIVNPTGIGYYRVNYEEIQWINLARILNEDFSIIPYTTQTILIDDALNLARFGLLNYSIAFNLVAYLKNNDDLYQPWRTAMANLKFVYFATEDLPNFHYVQQFMEEIVVSEYKNGNIENEKIKFLITKWACQLGVTACIEKMKNNFHEIFVNNATEGKFKNSESELLLTVCTTLKYSGFYEWKIAKDHFTKGTDIVLQKILAKSLGCTREISLIRKLLDLLNEKSFVPFTNEILTSISENKIALKYTLDFLYNDWMQVRQFLSLKQLSIIFENIQTENDFERYEQIFFKYSSSFQAVDKEILKRVRDATIKVLQWKREIGPKIYYQPFIFNNTFTENIDNV